MQTDSLPSAWFYRLKAAQRDLIKRVGGIERAGDIANVSKSQMGRFNNDGDPELMPLQVALMLQRECGVPLMTDAMAGLEGYRLTRPEEGSAAANATIMSSYAETVVQAGELISRGALAFADGKLTAAEAAGIDRAAGLLEQGLSELRRATAAARAAGTTVVSGGA